MGRLQINYKTASSSSNVSQLNLYNSYKSRFDPYATHTPLLGGQELVQLACATFPGSEMAKLNDDYILRGMKVKEEQVTQSVTNEEGLERRVDDLVEPLRASSWYVLRIASRADGKAVEHVSTSTGYPRCG